MISATALIAVLVVFVNRFGTTDLPLYGFTFASFAWVAVCFSILRGFHLCTKVDPSSEQKVETAYDGHWHLPNTSATSLLVGYRSPRWKPTSLGDRFSLGTDHWPFSFYMSLLKPTNQDLSDHRNPSGNHRL